MNSGRKLVVLQDNTFTDESVHILDENFEKQVSPLLDFLAKKTVEKTELEIIFLNNEHRPEQAPVSGDPDKLVELRIKNAGEELVLTLECNKEDRHHVIKHHLSPEEINLIKPELQKLPDFLKKHAATFSDSQNAQLEKLVHTLQFF